MKPVKKILIVDDEEDLRDMMRYAFKARGFDVVTAANGAEGLECLKTVKPALIILDINMPVMSGVDMYARICGPDGKPSHPVLILTARVNTRDLFKMLAIDGFLAKPFELDDLISEAEMIIGKYAHQIQEKRTRPQLLDSVFIVNDDREESLAISGALLHAGYHVALASSGILALEMMAALPPKLVLVKLKLADIPGDVLVLQALYMVKTSHIKFLLFEDRDPQRAQAVRQRLAMKSGVWGVIEYSNIEELVEAVAETLEAKRRDRAFDDDEVREEEPIRFVEKPYLGPKTKDSVSTGKVNP